MTIGFILNGEDVSIRAEAEERLIDILRDSFGLLAAKSNCSCGSCGLCSVILNNDVVKSCLIPAFRLGGCEIVTMEGFSQTNEYQDIITTFAEVHLGNCGYCESGKILCTEALLERNKSPSTQEILIAFSGIKCRCTNAERLIKAVNIIAEIRKTRLYGRAS